MERIAGGFFYQLSHKGSPRILGWVAYPFSSGSFQPRDRAGVSCIAGGFFTRWATREAPKSLCLSIYKFILQGVTSITSNVFFFKKNAIYLFNFGYAGSSLQRRLFSSCREWGLLSSWSVRLPIAGASLVVEHRLGHMGSAVVAPEFWSAGLIVVAHGLSCSEACGIFLDQGSNPCLLHWQVDSLQLSH